MLALIIIVALLGLSALITLIGLSLIARSHPPRGQRIDVDGLLQHVVDRRPVTGGAGG